MKHSCFKLQFNENQKKGVIQIKDMFRYLHKYTLKVRVQDIWRNSCLDLDDEYIFPWKYESF